jgi:hypothetical protein
LPRFLRFGAIGLGDWEGGFYECSTEMGYFTAEGAEIAEVEFGHGLGADCLGFSAISANSAVSMSFPGLQFAVAELIVGGQKSGDRQQLNTAN